MTPSPIGDRDKMQWLEKRLRWNIMSQWHFTSPISTATLTDQLYQQDRRWFQEQRTCQFLDRIRNSVRAPELARITRSPQLTICVSNIYARSQLDIQSRLPNLGITIIQEAPANFEIRYKKYVYNPPPLRYTHFIPILPM